MKGDIFTYVKHSGEWLRDDYYQAGVSYAALIPPTTKYEDLTKVLFTCSGGKLNQNSHKVVSVKYETEGAVKPIVIDSDISLACYLHIQKEKPNTSIMSLVLELESLKTSSAHVGSTPNTGESGFPGTAYPGAALLPPVMKCDSYIPDNISEESHLPAGEPSDVHINGNISDSSGSDPPPAAGEPSQPPPPAAGEPSQPPPPAAGEPSSPSPSQGATTVPSSDSTLLDVMDIHSPIRVCKGGLYANKAALQKHLSMYAINNHFTFKVRTSTTQYLHVVCRDDSCKWTVRAVRLRKTLLFHIRR